MPYGSTIRLGVLMKTIESLSDYLLNSIFKHHCYNKNGPERISDPFYQEKGIEVSGMHIDHIQSMIDDGKYYQDDNIEGDDNDYLGSFKSFSSPALITLNVSNLSNFVKYLIKNNILQSLDCYNRIIPCNGLRALIWLTILKTYIHECIHYFVAIENKINKSPLSISKLEEEAVAVSFSYHIIANYTIYKNYITNSKNYSLNSFSQKTIIRNRVVKINLLEELIPDFLDLAYKYSKPGYKNFVRVHDISQLISSFIINRNSEYSFLQANLVAVNEQIKNSILYQLSYSKNILYFK